MAGLTLSSGSCVAFFEAARTGVVGGENGEDELHWLTGTGDRCEPACFAGGGRGPRVPSSLSCGDRRIYAPAIEKRRDRELVLVEAPAGHLGAGHRERRPRARDPRRRRSDDRRCRDLE
jgi:hypothetical protein